MKRSLLSLFLLINYCKLPGERDFLFTTKLRIAYSHSCTKNLAGWKEGWMDGWVDGWIDG